MPPSFKGCNSPSLREANAADPVGANHIEVHGIVARIDVAEVFTEHLMAVIANLKLGGSWPINGEHEDTHRKRRLIWERR